MKIVLRPIGILVLTIKKRVMSSLMVLNFEISQTQVFNLAMKQMEKIRNEKSL